MAFRGLNGWQRLWVLAIFVWLLVCCILEVRSEQEMTRLRILGTEPITVDQMVKDSGDAWSRYLRLWAPGSLVLYGRG